MFNIIAVIVAVALGGVISATAINGIGHSVLDRKTEAEVLSYENAGIQIVSGLISFKATTGAWPTGCVAELQSAGYLQDVSLEVASGISWVCEAGKLTVRNVPNDVCLAALVKAGWNAGGWTASDGIPSCPADNTATPYPPCCSQP